MSETERRNWKTYVHTDGELMVPIADVLLWLRECETAWANTLPERPAIVMERIADDLRDAWLDAVRRPTEERP